MEECILKIIINYYKEKRDSIKELITLKDVLFTKFTLYWVMV